MKYDAIFFDIGNTLFFYNYDFLRDLLSDRFGVAISSQELEEAHQATLESVIRDGLPGKGQDVLWRETYRRWFERIHMDEDRIQDAMNAVRTHPFRHLFWARADEGTRETLDWFRERGMKLGVISNAEGQIKRLLEHTALDSRFEVILDSGVEGVAKPDKRIFERAAAAMGVSAERSIYVGDLYDVDVLGSKGAGMTPILVDRHGRKPDAECMTVAKIAELPKLPLFSAIA